MQFRLTRADRAHLQLRLAVAAMAMGFAVSLSSCEREAPEVPAAVRSIRTVTVAEAAGGQLRRFSGLIEATESSALSFQIPGTVAAVRVNQGDPVRAGQVLATLDAEPYRLNVQAAEAEVERARAYLAQARLDYERHQRLVAQRAVAEAQFEVAQRNFRSAQSQVDFAVAKLNLAQRDLRNTTLVAPFDGAIAARLIDPFVEVKTGQTAFRIDATGRLQAAFGVPQTAIALIKLGMPATVTGARLGAPITARISEIGSAADAGNLFPVKATLLDPPAGVRPGIAVDVSLELATAAAAGVFVPLAAIAPGDRPEEGFAFVFDASTSTVRRTPVRASGPVAGNEIAVTGLKPGDVIAAAGVAFLADGQRVQPMPVAATR